VPALTDSDRNRIVVPDRQARGEDLGEVAKFGDEITVKLVAATRQNLVRLPLTPV
jgi:hypothetical protein